MDEAVLQTHMRMEADSYCMEYLMWSKIRQAKQFSKDKMILCHFEKWWGYFCISTKCVWIPKNVWAVPLVLVGFRNFLLRASSITLLLV